MQSKLEQLERLARLKDTGVLTEEEFQVQKALTLAAASEPSSQTEAFVLTADDVEGSWNPFQPVGSAEEARVLGDYGGVATGLLIATVFLDIGKVILGALRNAAYPDGVPYTDVLPVFIPVNGAIALLILALGVAFWKGRRPWAAIGLLVLSLLTLGGAVIEVLEAGRGVFGWLYKMVSMLLAAGAVYFSIQAVRGAFGARRLSRPGR